jgi:S1-C subfamily serine protease
MRINDLIVSVNSQRIGSVDDLHRFLREWLIGQPITITLLRRREKLEMTVLPSEAGA